MKKLLHPLTRLLLAVGLSAFSVVAFAQKTAVNGIVTDAEGAPLVGATVIVMQNARPEGGTTTNTEGKFTVNASQGQQLAVSYIGYREATVEVTSKTFYEIALQSDSEQIDDVVVVGYGTQKKSTSRVRYRRSMPRPSKSVRSFRHRSPCRVWLRA